MIKSDAELAAILPALQPIDRVAVDTEADSLHCYFEKLCLVQLSFDQQDYVIDPLAPINLEPLRAALADKEIILQGADFDLRLLKRAMNFTATRVFDTVVAARLLGLRAFSLAALVEKYFGVVLTKGSQKANWAQRPLPKHMEDYAKNDTHFLIPLAEQMEVELKEKGRYEWFQQSCQRNLAQTAIERVRDDEEAWRIAGAGALSPRAAGILRELWHWREKEAQSVDRPTFHILQNSHLLQAAKDLEAGKRPHFRHLTPRRLRGFNEAAERGLQLPEAELPRRIRRHGARFTQEMEKMADDLRQKRDKIAEQLGLDPSIIAPRATVESIAADQTRSEALLVPWQRSLLEV